MSTLRIYDLREGRVLALDLRDIIDLLAPRSLEATWIVSPVNVYYPTMGCALDHFEEVPGRANGNHLEDLSKNGASVPGVILSKHAHETRQVIWGQFEATLPAQTDAWITVRAIDSTFYEVTTLDEAVLAKISSTYRDVRGASGPVSSAPFSHVVREGEESHGAFKIRSVEVTGIFGNTLIKHPLE